MASHYWANWNPTTFAPEILRRDTRIYWQPQSSGTVGKCIGTFVGENPGSAQSIHGLSYSGYSEIGSGSSASPGDRTLRLILEVWKASVTVRGSDPAGDGYIEVLNTYYFRNSKSGAALSAWIAMGGSAIYSPGPSATSAFVLLGWGIPPVSAHLTRTTASLIPSSSKVIVVDSKCVAKVISGSALGAGAPPDSAMPSGILRRGLKAAYIKAVAPHL